VFAAGQRHGDGTHAEDHRRIPRRDTKHHAHRLAMRHGQIARNIEGTTSPDPCVVIDAASRSIAAAKCTLK
jgi:hypothetical protein